MKTLYSILTMLGWVGGIGLTLLVILIIFARSLLNSAAFYPEKQREPVTLPSNSGIKEIFIQASDGTKIQTFYFQNPNSDQLLLFFHGNAGNALHRFPDAMRLSRTPINVLLLSYRGYGRSGGRPSEKGIYLDAAAALLYARSVLKFPEEKTFILGRSLGATVAVESAQDNALAGLILVSPFSSGTDMATLMGFGWLNWAIGNPYDSLTKVRQLKMPLLIIHGEQDNTIPISLGEKLFKAAGSSAKDFIRIPKASHNDLIEIAGETYWTSIAGFIKKQ